MDDRFSLAGRSALVTGGAAGIGFAMGLALARAGAKVYFCSSRPDHRDAGVRAYRDAGAQAVGLLADVTDEAQVQAMADAIPGGADILVNNAGRIQRTPLCAMDPADFRAIVDVDLTGPFLVSRAVLPGMVKKGRGKIINVCSLMSEVGRETVSAYAAAKGGLKMLTKSIAAEYGRYNIQCNGIGPGYIATSQTAPLRQPGPDGSPHPFDTFLKARTPAGRWGVPEDLAGPAVFLASAASDFVNGQILYVDGGLLAYLGRQPQAD